MGSYFKTETDLDQNLIDDFLTVKGPFHRRILSEKNIGVQDYFLEKRKVCMQKFTKERKQPPVVILQQAIFYNIFIP